MFVQNLLLAPVLLLLTLVMSAPAALQASPTLPPSTGQAQVCTLAFYLTPADLTVSCTPPANPGEPVLDFSGDCCEPVQVSLTVDTLSGTCPVLYRLRRTWTASDECGHTASAQQIITVQDVTAPIFTVVPANVTVSCQSIPPAPVIGVGVQATDNCQGPLTITASQSQIPGVCPQQYLIIRTWIAFDACQHSAVAQQTILVQDHEAPQFVQPPQDITIHCLAPPPPVDTIVAVDNCSPQIWYTFNEGLSGGTYCQTITRTRTWTAEDLCGNRSTHTQRIVQTDAGPPQFIQVPADATVQCGAIPPDGPVIHDDCDPDPLVQVHTQKVNGSCPGYYTLIRTWTASDDCGNSSSASQQLTVIDTEGPVITFTDPALAALSNGDTMKVSCSANVIYGLNDAQVQDACDPSPEYIFIDSLIIDNGCTKLMYCEWRATDFCGNITSFIFYMQVGDFTAPVFTQVPASVTISCQSPIPALAHPQISDDCDLGPKLTVSEVLLPGQCPQQFQIQRIWTAVDFCGNQSTAMQTIQVVDQQGPLMTAVHPLLIGQPNGVTLVRPCDNPPAFSTSAFQVTDNCDASPTVTMSIDTTEANCLTEGYRQQLTYTWKAEDDCGNQSQFTARVRLTDTQAPVFTFFPADLTLTCTDSLPEEPPVAADGCGGPVTLELIQTSQNLPCGSRIERTWTATDICGNSTSGLQVITITDTEAPTFIQPPADLTLSCLDKVPDPEDPELADQCDTDPVLQYHEQNLILTCPGEMLLTRTWTATDACGNSAVWTQKISIWDETPPFFTAFPEDATVACHETGPDWTKIAASDACSEPVHFSYTDLIQPGSCPDSYQIHRTFIAADACGNTTAQTQVLEVRDTNSPAFTPVPGDITLECADAGQLPVPAVSDLCDPLPNLSASILDSVPGSCQGEYTLLVEWTTTDRCGNAATATQVIDVRDTQGPVITPTHPILQQVPNGSEITVHCSSLPVMDVNDAIATDQCGPVTELLFKESVQFGDCPKDGYLFRLTCSWEAEDACGNTSTYTVYIKVIDNQPPQWSSQPADVTIDAKNGQIVPPAAVLTATDLCDKDPQITFTESSTAIACGYILHRIWTATDHCGNTTSHQQNLTVLEGCPCNKPEVAVLDIQHPKCGQSNGAIGIQLVQDPALFTYIWIPAAGIPNATGNIRQGLGAGTYQIFIHDPLASASCFTKVQVDLKMQWSCQDTVYLNLPMSDPYTTCLDSVLDFSTPAVSAQVCDVDPAAIAGINFQLPGNCLVIDPVDGFTGSTTVCVIQCHDANPTWCDTTILMIQITGLQPCGTLFTETAFTLEDQPCQPLASVCLPVDPVTLAQYQLTVNGQPYTEPIEGCDFKVISSYNAALLPGGGQQGPYQVESWIVQGQQHSGIVANITALLLWMNTRDPGGQWSLQGTQISGGQPGTSYGSLIIRQLSSNMLISLGLQEIGVPTGSQLTLGEGNHVLRLTESLTGCEEDLFIQIICPELPDALIAIDDTATTLKSKAVLIDVLANDIIPFGTADQLRILHYPSQGEVAVRADLKVLYSPRPGYCGSDRFIYEVCTSFGCDEAEVWVDIACIDLTVHTGFSPNGDGINDTFTITGIEAYPENELTITNRWGNQVYYQRGYKNEWNGTWDNGELPDGVYFYFLNDGKGRSFSGYVQLQR